MPSSKPDVIALWSGEPDRGHTPHYCLYPSLLFGNLFDVVLQQVNFYARAATALAFYIADGDCINAVRWNLVVQYQIPDHRVCHLARVGDGGVALTRSETLHFDDVAMLILKFPGHLVERVF